MYFTSHSWSTSVMVLQFILLKVTKERFSQPKGYPWRVVVLHVYLLCLLSMLLKALLCICIRKQIPSNFIQQELIQEKLKCIYSSYWIHKKERKNDCHWAWHYSDISLKSEMKQSPENLQTENELTSCNHLHTHLHKLLMVRNLRPKF